MCFLSVKSPILGNFWENSPNLWYHKIEKNENLISSSVTEIPNPKT